MHGHDRLSNVNFTTLSTSQLPTVIIHLSWLDSLQWEQWFATNHTITPYKTCLKPLPFPDQVTYRVKLVNALKSDDWKCVRFIPSIVSFWRWTRLGRTMGVLKVNLWRASPRLRVTRLDGSFVVPKSRYPLTDKSRDCRAFDFRHAIVEETEKWPWK